MMDAVQLALIALVTARLREKGYRYLAELDDDGAIVIRIYQGLDEA